MKFYSIPTLVVLLLVSTILQGQIKDQYQDDTDALTTVVVKEDSANDLQILNNQFDLDEIGMHEVIRITTRPDGTQVIEKDVPPSNDIDTSEASSISQTQDIKATEEPVSETTLVSIPEEATTSEQAQQTSAKESNSRTSSYSSSNKNKKSFKAFNKRFKKQKRKRRPRRNRNKKCYRF